MEDILENDDFGFKTDKRETLKKKTDNVIKPNKCNQCDHSYSRADVLRRHLKTHNGEKPNKCNQCDYASSWADALGTHLKTHSGEKPNKCNQCDYASSQAGFQRSNLKTHRGENHSNVTNDIIQLLGTQFE